MSNPEELIVVAVAVLIATAYLTRRYIVRRLKPSEVSSPCGKSSCGCSATKPPLAKR